MMEISRRRTLMLGLLGLGGCSSISPSFDLVARSISQRGAKKNPITPEAIDAIPYSTLGVRIGSFSPAVMVLAKAEGDELTWISADHIVLVTRNGRLVRTRGLKRDLVSTSYLMADPLEHQFQQDESDRAEIARRVDINREIESNIEIRSSFSSPVPDSTETLLRGRQQVVRIEEDITVPQWRWETKNTFWLDPVRRTIFKSRQQYCPEVDAITMELLKIPPISEA